MTASPARNIAIAYRRSGGLAGIDMVAELHSGELSAQDAAVVRSLLAHPPAAKAGSNAGRSDQFDHRLTLTDGDSERNLHWSDAEVPDEARSLIATLGRRAEPTRH